MLERVAAYVEQYQLLPEQGEVIVAVSGGADSLCLLHLLHRLCGQGKRYPGVRLRVAHLNHQLREEANTEAEAVAQLASAWGLPITIGAIDVPALARAEGRSLEDAARVARYRFLRDIAHGQPIAVAHHAGDQVETLLLHLLRGGGLAAQVGMQPRQQDIIRPLLTVTHAETVEYCAEHGLIPIEDASNTDPRFLRNRIRHELLPLLEALNPGIRATLLRSAEVAQVDMAWIEQQVNAAWPTVVLAAGTDFIELSIDALLKLPLSLQRHLLRRVTAQLSAGQSPLELRHYHLIEQLFQREPTYETLFLDLSRSLRLSRHFTTARFERLSQEDIGYSQTLPAQLTIPGRVVVTGASWIASAEMVPDELAREVREALSREDWPMVWRLLPSTRYVVYVDAQCVGSYLEVRTRRPGDRMRPLGMVHEKKVQDILVDKHIPRAERDQIPLFVSSSHCVWLAGVTLDDRVRLTPETQHIVRLTIQAGSQVDEEIG